MHYKYAGLMFLLLTSMNSNAWMSQTVHGIGGLLEVAFAVAGVDHYCKHKSVSCEIAGSAIVGVDALPRIASYTSSIGDNAYIQGTLQVTPVVQTAFGLWCVGTQENIEDKVLNAFLAVDGTLRLYENYKSHEQNDKRHEQSAAASHITS